MSYQVRLKNKVLKELKKIPEPYYSKIKDAIYKLSDNPPPPVYIKLKTRPAYRFKIADYRIIYEIYDNILLVDVINLGHRKDIYE